MTENEAWKLYKKRRKKRLDEKEDGKWITTENGHKVHLNEEGAPDKGNSHVIEAMNNGNSPSGQYKKFSKEINGLDKKRIVALAKKDPKFKELVDAITLYTQGGYGYQKKLAKDMVKNGIKDDGETAGELFKSLDDGEGFIKQLWNGQKLSESQSSVVGGVVSMVEAINNAEKDSPELYRLADDRGYGSLTHEKLYIPPKVGDKIKMDVPTSFTKDKEVLKEIDKAKYGDRIYYTLEPGSRTLNIEGISRFKQKESLTCGEFEVTGVKTEVKKMFRKKDCDKETLKRFKDRPTFVDDNGEEWYGPLKVNIGIRQVGKTEFGKRNDSVDRYLDCRNHFDDDGRWITTENGHHVHLNEEGEPDKGNPHVLNKMNSPDGGHKKWLEDRKKKISQAKRSSPGCW